MFIGAEDIKEISPTQKVGEISVSDLEERIAKMEKVAKNHDGIIYPCNYI
jgi:hypothetical protein